MHPVIGCRTKTVKGEKAPAIERQFYTQNHRESLLVAVIEGKAPQFADIIERQRQ